MTRQLAPETTRRTWPSVVRLAWLHLRSHRVPAALAGLAVCALTLWAGLNFHWFAGAKGTAEIVMLALCGAAIGLLLSLATGGLLSWIGPLAWEGICQLAIIANYSEPVTWAARPPDDRGGWIAAMVVFAVGLGAYTVRGPRVRPSGE